MSAGLTATATLELSLGVRAPDGVLIDGHGRARRFSGWIELAAAIEDWRTASSPANAEAARQRAGQRERRFARASARPKEPRRCS